MLATGRIRNYQIVVGGLQMMNLPVSYVLLRCGCIPETVLIVAVCISQCCLAARLLMLRGMIGLSVRKYLRNVYANIISVTVVAAVVPFAVALRMEETFISFIIVTCVALCCSFLSVFYIGCNRRERDFVRAKAKSVIRKITNK